MRKVTLELNEKESLLIEFYLFEHQSMINAMDMFISKSEFEYDEDHVNILFEKYTEKYTKLFLAITQVAKHHEIEGKITGYDYANKTLVLNLE